nr:MAG TPA_asm: type I neck protein [Caudoviricetes sp.]
MSRTKFRFKLAGLNTLMRSGEMQSILTAAAKQIAAAAGDGYEAETARPLTYAAIASAYAGDYDAKLDNSEHNTLLKAAGSVKL